MSRISLEEYRAAAAANVAGAAADTGLNDLESSSQHVIGVRAFLAAMPQPRVLAVEKCTGLTGHVQTALAREPRLKCETIAAAEMDEIRGSSSEGRSSTTEAAYWAAASHGVRRDVQVAPADEQLPRGACAFRPSDRAASRQAMCEEEYSTRGPTHSPARGSQRSEIWAEHHQSCSKERAESGVYRCHADAN
eukprot:4253234-Pleurochrysis_carterae.AAC.3